MIIRLFINILARLALSAIACGIVMAALYTFAGPMVEGAWDTGTYPATVNGWAMHAAAIAVMDVMPIGLLVWSITIPLMLFHNDPQRAIRSSDNARIV